MKTCTKCGEEKDLVAFGLNPKGKDGLRSYCKLCGQEAANSWLREHPDRAREYRRTNYRRNIKTMLVGAARARAQKKSLEFKLTKDDFEIPEVCPILGCPLEVGTGKQQWNSPSLDRKDPTRGYTPDNVWVISHRANMMKSDASVAELLLFRDWIERTYGQDCSG